MEKMRDAKAAQLTEKARILLEGWARDGLTDEQIAAELDVTPQELSALAEKFPEIAEAINRGRNADRMVERALLERAQTGDARAQAFWISNHRS